MQCNASICAAVPSDRVKCGGSCHVRLASCISLIPVALWTLSSNEAGLIMRTDWEVIRQAASDRTLRVWVWTNPSESWFIPFDWFMLARLKASTAPRCNVSEHVPLEFGAWFFLDELRLLEQSLVVSGTCARDCQRVLEHESWASPLQQDTDFMYHNIACSKVSC